MWCHKTLQKDGSGRYTCKRPARRSSSPISQTCSPADTPAQDLHAGAPLLSHKPAVRQIHLHKTCAQELLSYLTNLQSGRYTCTRPARRSSSPISQTCSPADTPAQDLHAGTPLLSHKPAVRQIHLHKTCTQELLSYLTNLQSGRYTCTRSARRSSSPISQTCSPADTPAQDLHAGAPLLSHKPAVRQIHLHKICTQELLSYLTNLQSGRYTCTRPARRSSSPISQTCSPADTPAQDLHAGAPLLSHKPAVRQIHLHKICAQELLSYLTNLQSGRYTCTRSARRSSSPISQTCSPADTPAQDLHAGAPLLSHKPAVRQIHLHKICTQELLSYLTNLQSGRYTCTRSARRSSSPISQTRTILEKSSQELWITEASLQGTVIFVTTGLQRDGHFRHHRATDGRSFSLPQGYRWTVIFVTTGLQMDGHFRHHRTTDGRSFSSLQDYRWTVIFVTTGLQMDGHFRHYRTTDGRSFSLPQGYRWTVIFVTKGLQMDGHFRHHRTTDGRSFSSLQDYRWTVIFVTTGLQMDGHFRYHKATDGRSFSLPQGYRWTVIFLTTRLQMDGHFRYHKATDGRSFSLPQGYRWTVIFVTTRLQMDGHFRYHRATDVRRPCKTERSSRRRISISVKLLRRAAGTTSVAVHL